MSLRGLLRSLDPGCHARRRPPRGGESAGIAGDRQLTLKLTGASQALLKHHRQQKLTAKGSFTRPGSTAITALKTFTLKR